MIPKISKCSILKKQLEAGGLPQWLMCALLMPVML